MTKESTMILTVYYDDTETNPIEMRDAIVDILEAHEISAELTIPEE